MKLCISLVITGALEVQTGVENLWKSGEGVGLKDYPNYGQYLPKNYMSVFINCFPFMWAEKEYWYLPKQDIPWEMFIPFVGKYNATRRNLVNVVYLILDESMSGWRPKTTKTGGFPNLTWEPRKPVELGTMIRNAAECVSGLFINHDIVQTASQQASKKYVGEQSSLPKGEAIGVHTAEVLRQCEGAAVKPGGWVGGDAWFGSINTTVELKKKLGIFSTFIVKGNVNYFPMDVLKSVLLARYPKRPAGHWVVMKATISEVELFIMAYAWSNKGISYIVSSCGTTIRHERDYVSKFEDGFGNTDCKALARPAIAHMLYEFLPLIDEHNKARQNALGLERKWPTKNCWFRLMCTFIGMAVVDLQRWDRNMRDKKAGKKVHHIPFDGDDTVDDCNIITMADLIGKGLKSPNMQFREGPQPNPRGPANPSPNQPSKLAATSDNRLVRYLKDGKLASENGDAYQRGCFVCRCYGMDKNTQWVCHSCGMSLCAVPRRGGPRDQCLQEHLQSDNWHLGCGNPRKRWIVPPELLQYRQLSVRSVKDKVEERHTVRRRDRVPHRVNARKQNSAKKQKTSPTKKAQV